MSFTIIDNSIFNDNLSISEQSLLIAIKSYVNKEKGYAYPSYAQLKKRSKIKHNSTLIKSIKNLINKGYIKKETSKGIGNKYYIIYEAKLDCVKNSTTSKDAPTASSKTDSEHVQKQTTTITNINKITKTNTNNIYNENQIKNLSEKILDMYPKIYSEKQSISAICKVLTEISYEELENCVKRYLKHIKKERDHGFNRQYLNSVSFFKERYKRYTDANYKQTVKDTISYNNKLTNFANYEQREYDYDELERKLLATSDYEAEKIRNRNNEENNNNYE